MEEWKTYRLEEVCKEIFAGGDASKHVCSKVQTQEYAYPIYSNGTDDKALYGYTNTPVVKTPAITISARGTIGFVALRKTPFVPIVRLLTLIPNEKTDTDFLYYTLKNSTVDSTGSATQQLTVPMIKDKILSLPPLPLQRRISSLLSSLDAKIETNRKINARLEEMAQALFRSWFIDFTPFKQQEFVEDEYGRRPKGWRFVELGEVTKECKDKVKERTDVKVLSPITTGQLVLSDEYFTKQVYSKDLSKYIIVEPNAFAYNPARVNIGSIGINDHGFEGCVSPVYVVFKTLPNYERFMNLFIKTRAFKEEVLLRAIGGVRQTLNYTEFSLITTNWPPESVILKFNSIYDTIIKSIKQNEQESSRLAALRDTLLPKLMSGELIPEEITT